MDNKKDDTPEQASQPETSTPEQEKKEPVET
jgi:hypothetical protein